MPAFLKAWIDAFVVFWIGATTTNAQCDAQKIVTNLILFLDHDEGM